MDTTSEKWLARNWNWRLKVAGGRLRGRRVMGVVAQLIVELFGRDADFVEVPAIAELDSARDHVDVQSFHILVANVGARIRDHRE